MATKINPNQDNRYTIQDAKEALFRALTLKAPNGSGSIDIPQPTGAIGKEATRNA